MRFALRMLKEGLIHSGYAYWMIPPGYYAARDLSEHDTGWEPTNLPVRALPAPLQLLLPPHPERLVSDQPLTEQEAGLWAQMLEPRETEGRNAE